MDDLDVLARDFGFGGRGKSNPMKSNAGDLRSSSTSRYDDHSNRDDVLFNDVFGGPPKYTNSTTSINNKSSSVNDFDYDSIFKSSSAPRESKSSNEDTGKTSSLPVYDKPVYDDDIFDGLPGMKSKSPHSAERFDDDVFVSMASPPKQKNNSSTADHFDDLLGNFGSNHKGNNKKAEAFDDLLGNLGKNERAMDGSKSSRSSTSKGLDDLLGGFGSGSPASGNRSSSFSNHGQKSAGNASQSTSHMVDDPFVVLESTSPRVSSSEAVSSDPLVDIDKLGKFRNTKTESSSGSGGVFDDIDPLNRFRKSAVPSPELSNRGIDTSPSRSGPSISGTQPPKNSEHVEKSSFRYSESRAQAKVQDDNFQDSPVFDMPSADSQRSFHRSAFSSSHTSANNNETNFQGGLSPGSDEHLQPFDDAWLTVSEIPLFTQPTRAPPPSRPPPPIPRKMSKKESSFPPSDLRKRGDDFASPPGYSATNNISRSQIDELEDFAMGSTKNFAGEASTPSGEETNASSVAAAAMKEAMDKAEAKFRHAKEVRERESAKAAKTKEPVFVDQNEDGLPDTKERGFQENQERERWQREEEEKEERRLEKEREKIEKEKARQAVERATREARERAAAEARLRAERAAVGKAQNEARERAERVAVGKVQNEARERAERAAVGKVQNEARERAERAAVLRAQTEARERAAAEARERQEKAAAEAREREAREKAAEARRRAERTAVDRAAAEARQRAAAEARERAAASQANQQKNDNDVESFFKMDSRASSVPRARDNSYDSIFDPPPPKGPGGPQGPKTTNVGSSPNMTKAFSSTNIVDDLSSIFGVAQPGEFQEAEGETEERRKARLERHQRTQERAAKALAEKNQRDVNAQREQEERHRIGETLDLEIKRWAAGKEGNLRALLSTLQYVLWPECGWQAISLTDLIVGVNVKKAYRKATLCIHPDKVQQKGATLQQKYIAEKVFDLLKEAWNKFNSEELF